MRLLPLAVLALQVSCTPDGLPLEVETESAPIVGGDATTDYPAVPRLSAGFGDGTGGGCTGTLVSQRVILTAAHCLENEEGSEATQVSAYFGSTLFGQDDAFLEQIPAEDWIFFDDWTLAGKDVGLVLLEWDAPVEPMQYNTVSLDGGDVGRPIHLVGWGDSSEGSGAGVKREVTSSIIDFPGGGWIFRYGTSTANSCQGDSGGPVFIDIAGTETVAGVISYGTGACLGISGAGRVSVYRDWIADYIAANDIPIAPTVDIVSPADGDRVRPGFSVHVEAEDNTRVEALEMFVDGSKVLDIPMDLAPFIVKAPVESDGPVEVEIVATDNRGQTASQTLDLTVDSSCSNSDECESGFKCEMGMCIVSEGVLGDECREDADCLDGFCPTVNGENRCSASCDPTAPACPEDFECLGTSATEGLCWPLPEAEDEGGCGCQGVRAADGWLGLLLVLFAWGRTRRSQRLTAGSK